MREPTLDEFVVKANHTLRIVNAVLVVTAAILVALLAVPLLISRVFQWAARGLDYAGDWLYWRIEGAATWHRKRAADVQWLILLARWGRQLVEKEWGVTFINKGPRFDVFHMTFTTLAAFRTEDRAAKGE